MLTIDQGAQQAKLWADKTAPAAIGILRDNRDLFEQTRGGVSIGLAVGHLCYVNPAQSVTPRVAADRREGYMKVSATEFTDAGVRWEKRNNRLPNGYVWGWSMSDYAKELHSKYGDLFASPNESFWKLVYLRRTLGSKRFYTILKKCPEDSSDLHQAFKEQVEKNKQVVGAWDPFKLSVVVLRDCEYVFHISRLFGVIGSQQFGKYPVLNAVAYKQVF